MTIYFYKEVFRISEREFICKNELIDMSKQYKVVELKIFYNMLYCHKEQQMFNPDLSEDGVTYMPLYKLDGYIGRKHRTDKELVKIIESIPKGLYTKKKKEYIAAFEYIKYNDDESAIEFKVCDRLIPLLDPLIEGLAKRFTVLNMSELSMMNSIYSQRLYEFASKNKNLGRYLMPSEEFKEYFNVPESYRIDNIDKRIIKVMVDEVNKNTKLKVKVNKKKRRNIITHIEFIFK